MVLQWDLEYMCLFELQLSQGVCPVVGFLGYTVVLFLVFKVISILFSIVAASVYVPNSGRGFFLLHILSSIYCLYNTFFDGGHSDQQRRQWHPTPVLLPGKSHGRRSLVGCSPWGHWVGHNWATSLSLFTCMHWRRKWQPTPMFLPGESQERGSLVGCHLWGGTESDTTAAT